MRSASFAELCDGLPLRHLPSAHLDGVGSSYQGKGSQRIYVARMAANAMRALAAGLGDRLAEPPPPVYAFDADVGRLSVSTRRYAAAVFVENRGAFPYGGIELARFSDADAVPVGGVGGRPPAAFGIVLRRAGRRRVLATQGSPRRRLAGPDPVAARPRDARPPASAPAGRRAVRRAARDRPRRRATAPR